MEQKFGKNSIDIEALREFCEREGKMVEYRKGEQLEREGDPARWFGFVTEGCFKYITRGISDERNHLTWFSFEGEFVADYPCVLSGQPSQATIEAMMPCRVWQDIASFLNVTPKTISKIRKGITFEAKK